MSPEEVELLQDAGEVLLLNISAMVAASILYGLYFVIFAFGIRALLKRRLWTKYTWILFGFLSILFLFSTLALVTGIAHLVGLIRGAFINHADQPLMDRLQLANQSVAWSDVAGIWVGDGNGGGFLFVFADAVVVWRACVLWPNSKVAKAFPLGLLLASFGCATVSAALETISISESSVLPTSSPTGIMLTLSQSLSLATNVVATILIGYKAYQHRQIRKASMGVESLRSGAILLFLTESGIAFCVLQIIALATTLPDNTPFSPLDYTVIALQNITFFAAVAYPVLVTIIVDSHRSISDHTGSSAGDSGFAQGSNARSLGVGSHLSFAASPRGICSAGSDGGVGAGGLLGSRVDPTAGADHSSSNEGTIQSKDLEKGESLISDVALPDGHC